MTTEQMSKITCGYVGPLNSREKDIYIITDKTQPEFYLNLSEKIIDIFKEKNIDLLIIIDPQKAPGNGARQDKPVTTIAFKFKSNAILSNILSSKTLEEACYWGTTNFIDADEKCLVLARSLDDLTPPSASPKNLSNHLTVVIPHQGYLTYLEGCLHHCKTALQPPKNISVYFDEEVTKNHFLLAEKNPDVTFKKIAPTNLGPYVGRNHCIENSKTEYLCFQDSDDLPTYERFAEIYKYLAFNSNTDMVGCHELRIDYFNKKIYPIRFPLDVSQALKTSANHPLFHPTSVVKQSSAKRSGLFTTIRRFGSDSQFLLRSHFFMRTKNIDKFLYIRRKRPNSLTTAPPTMLGCDERTHLDTSWKTDFEKIKLGEISLEDSSLWPEYTSIPFEIKDI